MRYREQSEAAVKQLISEPAAALALEVQGKLVGAGHQAFLVGGCVRDLFLNRKPKDYDVATSANPDQVTSLFPRAHAVGAKFGVMLVQQGESSVEVATFRKDGRYQDNRRPATVTFSTLEADAARRDFTINAMYLDPVTGQLQDLFEGMQDLTIELIRCVGDPRERFKEDALRLLRALRFAANLGYSIEAETLRAIQSDIYLLNEISAERIRDEIVLGFTGPAPARFLDLLDTAGALPLLLPEISALKGCEQPPEFHPEGDVYVHTRLMLEMMKPDASPELALSVLLHDIGKPPTRTVSDRIRFNNHAKVGAAMAERVCQRLRFSNSQTAAVMEMVLRHMDFMNVPNMRDSTLKRFLAARHIIAELELHRVDCLSSHKNLSTYTYAYDKLNQLQSDAAQQSLLPDRLVTGHDLVGLGLTPGPTFKDVLERVYDFQLENPTATHEDCLEVARRLTTL